MGKQTIRYDAIYLGQPLSYSCQNQKKTYNFCCIQKYLVTFPKKCVIQIVNCGPFCQKLAQILIFHLIFFTLSYK